MGEDDDNNGELSREHDGRSVSIDTGFYEVSVSGDPVDSLSDTFEAAMKAADRAKDDVEELDDRLDGEDVHYR
jgi:hypothetical protein